MKKIKRRDILLNGRVRKASIKDAKSIYALIGKYSRKGLMLPRSLNTIYENIRDFFIFENNRKRMIGCGALHFVWDDLAEIRSLAVEKQYQRKGVGKTLIDACLGEARSMKAKRVFALTFRPNLFKKEGFRIIDKNELPHKIWGECINCQFFPDCKEIALVTEL